MPGHKPRTNKGLAIAAVLMCLACGVSFTQSSASHSPITDTQIPDMFVAGNTDDSQIQSGGAAAENTDAEEENTPEDVIPTETPAADTPAPDTLSGSDTSFEVSPEASQGVWTPVDSNWYFMVNGEGYKGWLTDTDGHRYYFNDKGVMQTGWLELDGKRYYLNADGVLQTGDVTIDGEIYHFGADGAQQSEPTTADDSSNQDLVFYMNTTSDSSNADISQLLRQVLPHRLQKLIFLLIEMKIPEKLLPKSMILLKPLLQHQKSPLYRKPPLLRNRLFLRSQRG